MINKPPILFYLFVLLAVLILVDMLGIIEFSFTEITGYALIFYGMGSVYLSMGRQKKALLFTGSTLFLAGIIFFLLSKFDFPNPYILIVPSFMFIAGAGFLMLFIDDTSSGIILPVIASIFIIIGISYAVAMSPVRLNSFLNSIWLVFKTYWPVFIIVTAVLLLLGKDWN